MYISGKEADNPIYLVTPEGDYVLDESGAPLLFEGEAREDDASGYLTDEHGNFLLGSDMQYLAVPAAKPAEATLEDSVSAASDEGEASPALEEGAPAPAVEDIAEPEAEVSLAEPSDAQVTAVIEPDLPTSDAAAEPADANEIVAQLGTPPAPESAATVSMTSTSELPTPGEAATVVMPAAEPSIPASAQEEQAPTESIAVAPPSATTPAAAPSFPPATAASTAYPAQSAYAPEQTAAPAPATSPATKQRSIWPLVALGAIGAAALGIGAGWAVHHFVGNGDTSAQSQSAPSDSGEQSAPRVEREQADGDNVIYVPSDAYPGAGEAYAPSGAVETGSSDGSFDWMAPSENIRCWANGYDDEMRCMIASWQEDRPEGNAPGTNRPADTVILGTSGAPTLAADGGSLGHVNSVLLYDTSVYDAKRRWACGAQENGVTCWSLDSGHGFVIRRAGMLEF